MTKRVFVNSYLPHRDLNMIIGNETAHVLDITKVNGKSSYLFACCDVSVSSHKGQKRALLIPCWVKSTSFNASPLARERNICFGNSFYQKMSLIFFRNVLFPRFVSQQMFPRLRAEETTLTRFCG